MTPEQAAIIQSERVQAWLREHAPVAAGWSTHAPHFDIWASRPRPSAAWIVTSAQYAALLVGACVGSGRFATRKIRSGGLDTWGMFTTSGLSESFHPDPLSAVLAAILADTETDDA